MASSLRERARNVLNGVFAADAAGLGLHWNYQQSHSNVPVPEYNFSNPSRWHPKKKLGDMTHYGDCALVLAQTIAASGPGDVDKSAYYNNMKSRFFNAANPYNDYIEDGFMVSAGNKATPGPSAEDTEGSCFIAAPFAAVRYVNLKDDEFKVKATELIRLTHSNSVAVEAALGAAIATRFALLNPEAGAAESIKQAAASGPVIGSLLKSALGPGVASQDSIVFARENGMACALNMVCPVSAQAALSSSSFAEFVRKTIQSGGNSSARFFAFGGVLAAFSPVPTEMSSPMKAKHEVAAVTEAILDAAGL